MMPFSRSIPSQIDSVALGNLLNKHCTSIELLRFCRALVIGHKVPKNEKAERIGRKEWPKSALGSADSCSFGVHSTERHRHGPIERKPATLPRPMDLFEWHRECGMHCQPISLTMERLQWSPTHVFGETGPQKRSSLRANSVWVYVSAAHYTRTATVCGHWPNS